MTEGLSTCALCPRLCRPACPVATGTGREAAVPTFLAAMALEHERGTASAELAQAALSLCTDCGACQEHCHIHHPLPELLRSARLSVSAATPIEPLRPIVGDALVVAVEADERPLARVLERLLGCEVARWVTGDGFGAASLDTPNWSPKPLVEAARGRRVIVADGGVAKALTRAGVAFEWLSEHAPAESEGCAGSCVAGGDRPLACCGGGGPLSAQHPEDAVRVARAFDEHMEGRRLVDARCRNHLRRSGLEATDLLDELLEGA